MHKSTTLRQQVSTNFRAARWAYDPNASRVAEQLGAGIQALNHYEKGRIYPNPLILVRFCNMIDCPTDFIFRGAKGMQVAMPANLAAQLALQYPRLLREALPGSRYVNPDGNPKNTAALLRCVAARLRATRTIYCQFTYGANVDERSYGPTFARDIGISNKTLQAIEIGRNFPDQAFMVKFYRLTGCPIDWLMRGRLHSQISKEMAARIAAEFPEVMEETETDLEAKPDASSHSSARGLATALVASLV